MKLTSPRAVPIMVRFATMLAALTDLEVCSGPRGEPFLIDAYQATQVWLHPLVRTGYDEMTGAGLTHGLGDRETRSRLAAYYTQMRQFDITALNTTPYSERLRRALPCNDAQFAMPDNANKSPRYPTVGKLRSWPTIARPASVILRSTRPWRGWRR